MCDKEQTTRTTGPTAKEIADILRQEVFSLLPAAGRIVDMLPGLALTRIDGSTSPQECFYAPMVALVVQGYKYSTIGGYEANYGANQCVVVGMDMPGIYHVKESDDGQPFLSVSVRLDKLIISQLLTQMPSVVTDQPESAAPVAVQQASAELLDAFVRLVRLLHTPERLEVLAPLILREIHYYLLAGPQGSCLQLFNARGAVAAQIARAIAWIRQNYTAALNMEELARQVNMAPSTFNRHFKELTTYSPLQFQKKLRLYEAKRLMLQEGKDVNQAALQVGYESNSQFNREYKRQFGLSPKQDVQSNKA